MNERISLTTGVGLNAIPKEQFIDGIENPIDDNYAEHNWPGMPLGGVDIATAYGSNYDAIGKAQLLKLDQPLNDGNDNASDNRTLKLLAASLLTINASATTQLSASILTNHKLHFTVADISWLYVQAKQAIMPVLDLIDDTSGIVKEYRELLRVIISRRSSLATEVMSALAQNGIRADLFKGSYVGKLTGSERLMGDIDLFAYGEEGDKALNLITSRFSFRQGYLDLQGVPNDAQPFKIHPLRSSSEQWVRANSYEFHPLFYFEPASEPINSTINAIARAGISGLPYYSVAGNNFLEQELDLHFNIAVGIAEEDLRGDGSSLSDEAYLMFYAGRTYYETLLRGKKIFTSFTDAMAILTHHKSSIDWDRVIFLAMKYKAFAPMFYVFYYADQLTVDVVPTWVLGKLRHLLTSNPVFDLGDFMPRIFSQVTCGFDLAWVIGSSDSV